MNTNTLCNGDLDADFRVDVYLASDDGVHKLLGSVESTVNKLQSGEVPSLKCGKGVIHVKKFELKPIVNFLEYIFGGCRINLSVAIDFTLSNGDPVTDPNSLHMRDANKNEYVASLRTVGSIL